MTDGDWLAGQFEQRRGRLRAVAYRMLGSLAEADDAVQETWLRLARADSTGVENLDAWLTTVTARICLDMLRSRATRREESLDVHVPDLVVTPDRPDPEQEVLLADSVGLALLIVLDTLAPAERLAFVLHDIFAVPFERIGTILGRTPGAARQLASRARRRLQESPVPESDPTRQRQVVDAFLAASQLGDFDALVALLDPDVVLRADAGSGPLGPSQLLRGADAVAAQAMQYAHLAKFARRVLVNGSPGAVTAPGGRPLAVLALTVRADRIAEITILADPERLQRLGVEAALAPDPDDADGQSALRRAP